MDVVMLSGGWDSAYCLVKAKQTGRQVRAVFFDYGQPYLDEEWRRALRLAEFFGVRFDVERLPSMPETAGVFTNRNEEFLLRLRHKGVNNVWFGARNPLQMFDRFGDSNAQWVKRMRGQLGMRIYTPCMCMPKWWIKRAVRAAGVTDEMIYSTEGVL